MDRNNKMYLLIEGICLILVNKYVKFSIFVEFMYRIGKRNNSYLNFNENQ